MFAWGWQTWAWLEEQNRSGVRPGICEHAGTHISKTARCVPPKGLTYEIQIYEPPAPVDRCVIAEKVGMVETTVEFNDDKRAI